MLLEAKEMTETIEETENEKEEIEGKELDMLKQVTLDSLSI